MSDLKRDPPKHCKQVVEFTVGITPSVNHMYIGRTKRLTTISRKYIQDTQTKCLKALKSCKWKKEDPDVWYYMDLHFYFPDKRIRDSHNCIKLLMDSLEGVLFRNDYFVMPRIQHVELDKKNPRIEIKFFPQEMK